VCGSAWPDWNLMILGVLGCPGCMILVIHDYGYVMGHLIVYRIVSDFY
jgi:hypothetical protein